MSNSVSWVESVIRRLSTALPHLPNPLETCNDQILKDSVNCVVDLSQYEFGTCVNGLSILLDELNKTHPPMSASADVVDSYCTILNCLSQCLAKRGSAGLNSEDIDSLNKFFQRITQLCLLSGGETDRISSAACDVLYQLSGLHFHGIFNKIILRVTSVNRIQLGGAVDSSSSGVGGATSSGYNGEQCVIQLIPHLNLDASRLQQILQVMVTSFKDLKKHKNMFGSIPEILHKSIWNFIREYPSQFNNLLNDGYPSLAKSAEKLFNQCEDYASNDKRKSQIWPLQNTLLLLCPHLMESMAFSESDKSSSPKHKTQKNFLSNIMKSLSSSNKSLCESSVVCGTELFTACTYVSDQSSQIFRYFVTQMQGQLQTLLFSPSAPFLHLSSSIAAGIPTFSDLDLMVQCLASQFRLNHRNSHTFNKCLAPDSPPVFKLAFLRALHLVLKDAQIVSWWPNPEVTHVYAPEIRGIFQSVLPLLRRHDISTANLPNDIKTFLSNPTSAAAMLNAKRSNERKALTELIIHYQLTQWLIKLYILHPQLAFHGEGSEDRVIQEGLLLMTGLVSLIQHQGPPHLDINGSEVLLKLHQPENIELWYPSDPVLAFWEISCQVTYSITIKLFSRKTNNPIQLLRWLREILHYRISFLRKHTSEACQGANTKVSIQLYTMLETILLMFLRNTDIEVVQIAMSCFKYLVTEADLVTNPSEPSGVPYAPNIRSYKQLVDSSLSPQIGRVQQQKRIRAILRDLVHTPGSALAWEDTYSSWKVSKSLLTAYHPSMYSHHDPVPPDLIKGAESFPRTLMRRVITGQPNRMQEQHLTEENLQATILNWSNMTGFLCSLAGVSTKSSQSYSAVLLATSTNSGDIAPGSSLGRNLDANELIVPSNSFKVKRSSSYHGNRPKSVSVSQSKLSTQESVRFSSSGESLASDDQNFSSRSQTESFIKEIIALLSCENESVGIKVRQTVTELVSSELSPVVYPYLFHCLQEEMGKIYQADSIHLALTESNTVFVDQVESILQRIMEGKTEGAFENLGQVKVDQLLLQLVKYANSLEQMEKSLTMKIKLCALLQAVMVNSRELSFHHEIHFRNTLVEYLTQWVSGEPCTGESCTHEDNLRSELDLCAMKAIGAVLSGLPLQPKDISGDIIEEKGKLFLKHFTTFMNMVHSLNRVEVVKLGPLRKPTVLRHVSALREATILAMSNMLTANIDSGLTHAISLGYHEDLRTRTNFIEVLTFILKQGAEFNSLADTALADRYNQLLNLVTMDTKEGEHPVMIALINSVPFDSLDELAEVLVVLFDYKNKLPSFLKQILMTEVDALESGRLDTLFRGNTIACKVLSIAFKTFGLYYLQSVLRPLILNLMKTQESDFEVDPSRIQDPSKLERNRTHLLEVVSSFYDTILSSLPSLPLQLRTVCHILYQVVIDSLPDGGLDTVNSSIFLRFINPAIVSPQSYSLVQGEIPTSVRRALTLISKVLQNLANHVLFKKEAHMKVFNEFLADNFEKSRDLALNMASMGPYKEGEAVEYIGFLKEAYKYRLHSLLWNNQDAVASYAAATRTSISVRPIYHTLNTLLAQMGAPITPKRRTGSIAARTALVSSQLEEFLDSMSNECDEKTLRQIKAKEIFYQSGYSKNGNPVFYFIARKFKADQLQTSYQLLYHIMLLLKSCTERSFEIVLDLTQTSQHNEPDLELLIKFAAYIPELLMNQIEALYLYNMNIAFKNYAKKLSSSVRIFAHIKGAKRLIIVDSLQKFYDYIEPSTLKLPSSTIQFGQDGKEYHGVHYLVFKQHTLRLSAAVTILPCGFSIVLSDKLSVFDIPSALKEFHHISDIREVVTEGKSSLAIRLVDEGKIIKLSTSQAESIAKELNSTILRWQNQQPSRYLSERKLEPKDVPGTFLNLALLNLGSSEPWLRVAAYRLLCAVKETFKLELDFHLDDSYDLCIPLNSAKFVLDVSEQLAIKESHLTLEFLSEVIAGFQRYSTPCKQRCLAYMSPWIPNLSNFIVRSDSSTRAEHEKLAKIFDLLVSLTISEEEMYPLIQEHVWAKISQKLALIVVDSFIKASISEGVDSNKTRILADTVVTLARNDSNMIFKDIINRMQKTLFHTRDHPTKCLEHHVLWVELAVLAQFLLNLSFSNTNDVLNKLPNLFYLCEMMMGHGQISIRAAVHGILINTIKSLLSLPKVSENEDVAKVITLKLVEFSQPKFYLQFGLQNMKIAAETVYGYNKSSSQPAPIDPTDNKDPLNSSTFLSVIECLHEIMQALRQLYTDKDWHIKWQKLTRRSAFLYNPALQTRSFLTLGVISSHASANVITKTLKVLEEAVAQNGDDFPLMESIIICLTKLIPLLEQDPKLVQNLFWVAVSVMELEESSLYAAALGLLEGCIKTFVNNLEFESKNLLEVVSSTREVLLWQLNQLDREVEISFDSDFDFSLATLLYKGFSHSLSTVRTRTQELLTTLFFLHSPSNSDELQITEHNIAYLAALFPESDIIRRQLQDKRSRLKTLIPTFIGSPEREGKPQSYSLLLNTSTIPTSKLQILFLHLLASALIQSQSEHKMMVLYDYLADASTVYTEVFPLIHLHLLPHMSETLKTSPNSVILRSVQKLINTSIMAFNTSSSLIKQSYISDIGFRGVTDFFSPFPKSGLSLFTNRWGLFQKYLDALIQELSPVEGGLERTKLSSSLWSVPDLSSPSPPRSQRRSLSVEAESPKSPLRSRSRSRDNTPDFDLMIIEQETDDDEAI